MFGRTVFLLLFTSLLGAGSSAAQDYLYVSSRGSNSVKLYDASTGDFIRDVVTARTTRQATQDVAFGPDGNLYVSWRFGADSGSIYRFTPEGDELGPFTSGYELDEPTKISFGPDGDLYVSQWGSSQPVVARFDGSTGAFVREATVEQFNNSPMDHLWDDQGRLMVVSFGSKDVRRYDEQGMHEATIVPGFRLTGPVNLFYGAEDDLFVIDWTRGEVHRFDGTTYDFKEIFIAGLENAEGFAFGPDGDLYIPDWRANVINRYDGETGDFVAVFTNRGGLRNPNGLVFGPPTSITAVDDAEELPESLLLKQNYPNPFNPSTTISYTLQENAPVQLTVFDLFGREIRRLANGVQPAGDHNIRFDASSLPSGAYMYRLEAGHHTQTRVMTLLR